MSTDVEHASGHIQTTIATPSPTASTSGPKTSMFAKRAGFVIPKNKLSGSLVPISRGTKKGDADSIKEESSNQVERKTKWGPDLTLNNTVRKGRALAYQTRINQISQKLTSGTLEFEDNQDPLSTSEFDHGKTSNHQLSNEESVLLQLERREIIGEILKLNPTYKAPSDYKPLLKEAKVPIPIKEYPGYNFIGLVFGPASDTQKRLEKETGAKIRVYGIKADTGLKVEVTPTDGKEIENAYEDLYVNVSADTFEKIDAAVALIELLVTPVSVNPVPTPATPTSVSDDNAKTHLISQSTPSSIATPPPLNQGMMTQPYPGSLPPPLPPQGQFLKYPQPWFSAGQNQTPIYPVSSSSPFNPSNRPPLFGARPNISPSFSPVLQNPPRPRALQKPYMQQARAPLTGPPHNIPNNMISPLSGRSQVPMRGPSSQNFIQGPTPMPHHQHPGIPNSFSNFDSVKPIPGAIPRPQPSSSDFTFQPHHRPPPNAAASPFSRQMVHNLNQGFQMSQQQINQSRPQNFGVNPTVPMAPHGHNGFRPGSGPQMQPMNFIPPPHPRPINNNGQFPHQMHNQQNNPFPYGGPRFPQAGPHNQHFGNRRSRSGGGQQQVYDPFSPTSAPPFNPHNRGGGGGENDPEYEDLMASVGVK